MIFRFLVLLSSLLVVLNHAVMVRHKMHLPTSGEAHILEENEGKEVEIVCAFFEDVRLVASHSLTSLTTLEMVLLVIFYVAVP